MYLDNSALLQKGNSIYALGGSAADGTSLWLHWGVLSHVGLVTYEYLHEMQIDTVHLPKTLLYAYHSIATSTFSPYFYPRNRTSSVLDIICSNDYELAFNPATKH